MDKKTDLLIMCNEIKRLRRVLPNMVSKLAGSRLQDTAFLQLISSIYQAGQRTANLRQAIPPGSTGPRREKPDRQPGRRNHPVCGRPAGRCVPAATNEPTNQPDGKADYHPLKNALNISY